jgi:hypothetical protein
VCQRSMWRLLILELKIISMLPSNKSFDKWNFQCLSRELRLEKEPLKRVSVIKSYSVLRHWKKRFTKVRCATKPFGTRFIIFDSPRETLRSWNTQSNRIQVCEVGLMFMNEDCLIELFPVDFWKPTQLPRTLQANLVMVSAIRICQTISYITLK